MLNIPTDLLRTLVAVIDQRSFTKAAQSLGITQPAVSAQIKRLQFLLGFEVLDKSAPGVSLTPRGDIVVGNARRMLSINDQILNLTGGRPSAQTLRVGILGDIVGVRIPRTLANFHKRWPEIRFNVIGTAFTPMLRDLQQGDLDLVVFISKTEPAVEARHVWIDQAVWVRGEGTVLDPNGPVPLVSFGDDCTCRALAVEALARTGRDCDFVFTSRSFVGLEAAVSAGLGVMVLPRSRVAQSSLQAWEDGPLPELPALYGGIFLREGGNRAALEELADDIAAVLRPQDEADDEGAQAVPLARVSRSG